MQPTPQQQYRTLLRSLDDDQLLERAVTTIEQYKRFGGRQLRWDVDQIWFELCDRGRADLWPIALERGTAFRRKTNPPTVPVDVGRLREW